MAHIIYRKFGEPSVKKSGKWIPPNRKYKWMFYTLLSINLIAIAKILQVIYVP